MDGIFFNEAEHRYYDANGHTYISVTTLIDKYKQPYDTDFWSMYTALKERDFRVKPFPEKKIIQVGQQKYKLEDLKRDSTFKHYQAETKAKWLGISAEACERGNIMHKTFEDSINISKGDFTGNTNSYITDKPKKERVLTLHDLEKTVLKDEHPAVYTRLKGYIDRGCSIFSEKRLYLSEYHLAGTLDVPILFGEKGFCILDWKTNKDEFHDTAGYFKKEKIGGKWVKTDIWVETGETFIYPLDHLEASKKNIYALQLSMYAYMMEKWGYKLLSSSTHSGLELMHFPLNSEPRIVKLPYLKDEVEILLNHYKYSKAA